MIPTTRYESGSSEITVTDNAVTVRVEPGSHDDQSEMVFGVLVELCLLYMDLIDQGTSDITVEAIQENIVAATPLEPFMVIEADGSRHAVNR
jgi:hypothetical protein